MPVFLLLIDFQQEAQRGFGMGRALELQKQFLGPVQQSRLQVILCEFQQGLQLLLLRQILALG